MNFNVKATQQNNKVVEAPGAVISLGGGGGVSVLTSVGFHDPDSVQRESTIRPDPHEQNTRANTSL